MAQKTDRPPTSKICSAWKRKALLMTEFRFPTLKLPEPNTGRATKRAMEPNGRALGDCVLSSPKVWGPDLLNRANPTSGEPVRLKSAIGGARLSASPDAINVVGTIPKVDLKGERGLSLSNRGAFGGDSCAAIHLDDTEAATPNCLVPPFASLAFPRSAWAQGFENKVGIPFSCSIRKLDLAYIRAYRMIYWGFRTVVALRDPLLPWQVRRSLWEHDYASAIPEMPTWKMDPNIYLNQRLWLTKYGFDSKFNARNFFGEISSNTLQTIQYRLNEEWERFSPSAPKYTFIHDNCSDYWMWIQNNKTITICSHHFDRSSVGLLAASICHEFLHGVSNMNDQVLNGVTQYLPYRARSLAEIHPSLALKNNDNYTWWLYGMYFSWVKSCNIFASLKSGGKTYSYDMKHVRWIIK